MKIDLSASEGWQSPKILVVPIVEVERSTSDGEGQYRGCDIIAIERLNDRFCAIMVEGEVR